jgi:hypothetical protein
MMNFALQLVEIFGFFCFVLATLAALPKQAGDDRKLWLSKIQLHGGVPAENLNVRILNQ